MVTVPVYVEAFLEREEILHPEGAEIELPPEKEEDLPFSVRGSKDRGGVISISRGSVDVCIFLRHSLDRTPL
jgi:hypothetical protein